MTTSSPVGVIVARFQVANLHAGHLHLIGHVQSRHSDEDVLIVLGDHGGQPTANDPLTFSQRYEMVRGHFPGRHFAIEKLRDHPWSSDRWSLQLDELISKRYGDRPAIAYGSRMSFLDVYTGKHEKRQIPAVDQVSGSALRAGIQYSHGMDARSALIYAQQTREPIAYSAADIAIVDIPNHGILLGSKPVFDGKWAFFGGFFDPKKDSTDKETAARERREEVAGINTGPLVQLGERIRVDDPRYRNSNDTVVTSLYFTEWKGGNPVAQDDMEAVRWFTPEELRSDLLVPWHRPLADRALAHWEKVEKDYRDSLAWDEMRGAMFDASEKDRR
jgi:ADP-ribose pyrophosphatase YjhB (NUDIX family)